MDFNMQSAHAALLGAAYGTPLILCSIAARSELFKESFPVLAQLHEQQAGLQRRILAGVQCAWQVFGAVTRCTTPQYNPTTQLLHDSPACSALEAAKLCHVLRACREGSADVSAAAGCGRCSALALSQRSPATGRAQPIPCVSCASIDVCICACVQA